MPCRDTVQELGHGHLWEAIVLLSTDAHLQRAMPNPDCHQAPLGEAFFPKLVPRHPSEESGAYGSPCIGPGAFPRTLLSHRKGCHQTSGHPRPLWVLSAVDTWRANFHRLKESFHSDITFSWVGWGGRMEVGRSKWQVN